jgi:hypothetical protein
MNERFEQLKRRAVAEADTSHIDFDNMSHTEIQMLGDIAVEKKFAELIVRECLGCCEQVISDPVPESVDTWLNGGEQCIQEIKEHFGLGMSVEDKKTLIKDLLGVSNDTKS